MVAGLVGLGVAIGFGGLGKVPGEHAVAKAVARSVGRAESAVKTGVGKVLPKIGTKKATEVAVGAGAGTAVTVGTMGKAAAAEVAGTMEKGILTEIAGTGATRATAAHGSESVIVSAAEEGTAFGVGQATKGGVKKGVKAGIHAMEGGEHHDEAAHADSEDIPAH